MNIVVVGAGKVGTTLCQDLSKEGHQITLIEQKEARLQAMLESTQILGVQGNGAFYDVQMEAGVDHCDMFIAVTPEDENNIISSVIAKKLGAGYAIARVRMPDHAKHMGFVRDSLGIDRMINPDLEAAQEIYRMVRYPSALSIEPFLGGRMNLVELAVTPESRLAGVSLLDLRRQYKSLLVCIVVRGEKNLIPNGSTVLMEGDRVYLTGKPEDCSALYRRMGTVRSIRSLLIIGGGRICRYLLELIKDFSIQVKVIENDEEVARDLAVSFPHVSVIHGDGTDQNLLEMENIEGFDCVVTLTGIDEENILLSIFAATKKVPRNITKVNRVNLLQMLGNVGLQSFITPAAIATTNIVRVVRGICNSEGSKVEALYRLQGSSAEVLQFHVHKDAGVLKAPIKDLAIRPGSLIAGIVKNSRLIIPTGSDRLDEGDHVLVVTLNGEIDDLDDILE